MVSLIAKVTVFEKTKASILQVGKKFSQPKSCKLFNFLMEWLPVGFEEGWVVGVGGEWRGRGDLEGEAEGRISEKRGSDGNEIISFSEA